MVDRVRASDGAWDITLIVVGITIGMMLMYLLFLQQRTSPALSKNSNDIAKPNITIPIKMKPEQLKPTAANISAPATSDITVPALKNPRVVLPHFPFGNVSPVAMSVNVSAQGGPLPVNGPLQQLQKLTPAYKAMPDESTKQ